MRSYDTEVPVMITADECIRLITLINNEVWRVRSLLTYDERQAWDNKRQPPKVIKEWLDLHDKLDNYLTYAWEEADKDGSDTTGQGDPGSDQKGD